MTTTMTTGQDGQSGGRARGSGQGNRTRNRTTNTSKFEGMNKDLGVFETADERIARGRGQNQFVDTMKTLTSYAARKLDTKEGKTDIRDVLRDMKAFAPEEPVRPAPDDLGDYDRLLVDLYRGDLKERKDKVKAFKEGQTTMWAVILGQTSRKMLSELEATDNYRTALEASDILALIKGIKIVSYKFDGHRHKPSTLLNANRDLINYEQGTQHLDD